MPFGCRVVAVNCAAVPEDQVPGSAVDQFGLEPLSEEHLG